jgi:hypothetical protein
MRNEMEKLIMAVFGIAIMTSCKKDFSCQCSDAGTISETYTIHDTKKNAKSKRESNDDCQGCQYFAEHKCEIK